MGKTIQTIKKQHPSSKKKKRCVKQLKLAIVPENVVYCTRSRDVLACMHVYTCIRYNMFKPLHQIVYYTVSVVSVCASVLGQCYQQ